MRHPCPKRLIRMAALRHQTLDILSSDFIQISMLQDGGEFEAEQTVGKGGRMCVLVEGVHRVGLHDRKPRNRAQSDGIDHFGLQRSPTRRGGKEQAGWEKLENDVAQDVRQFPRSLPDSRIGVRSRQSRTPIFGPGSRQLAGPIGSHARFYDNRLHISDAFRRYRLHGALSSKESVANAAGQSERSQALKPNISQAWPSTMPTTTAGPVSSTTTNIPTNCYKVFVGCNTTISTVGLATLLVANLSTTSPLSENSLTPNITTEFPPAMNFTDTMSSNVSWDDGFSITDKEIEEFWKELSNTTNAYSNTTWTELGNVSSVWPFEFLFSKFYPSNHTMEETNHTHSTETHFENATSTAAPLSEETGNQFFGNVSKAPGEEIEESDCFVIRCHGLEHTILTPKLSTAFFPNGTNSSSTVPYEEPDAPEEDMSTQTEKMDLMTRKELRDLCWETMFGQELVKLTVMDLVSGKRIRVCSDRQSRTTPGQTSPSNSKPYDWMNFS
ncbi:unnamed protein product [Nesidiocoris tenuis]|uniref:Uncharacterized protein n=1 Tax=Nesidiocoris tenuis TaxID=355587 RepID=A0A6H5GTW9_9HEMI|nr:unnamed protein product [Nesidiocoris tenuis]